MDISTAARAAMLAGAVLLSSQVQALEPYQATYGANFKIGVSLSGKLVRTLTRNGDGTWTMNDNISASVATIKEKSHFKLAGDDFQTLNYSYYEKKLFKKRSNKISFDWNAMKATNSAGKTFAIKPQTLDSLNYQLKLQQDLQRGVRGKFSYQYVKKDKLDNIAFIELGQEQIKTPSGTVNAIKLQRDRGANAKRVTYIWLDPANNFIITKLQQTEPDGKSYSLVLEKLH
ncbi:MAG: DUF3108 domain-containing protein [Pseudomonadales bacterium]